MAQKWQFLEKKSKIGKITFVRITKIQLYANGVTEQFTRFRASIHKRINFPLSPLKEGG